MKHVLIIDSYPDSADSLADLVRTRGHSARVALDGVSGVRLARDFTPDVVVCDLRLKGLDGLNLCRELKQDPRLEHVYFVAHTGDVTPQARMLASKAGYQSFLAKPVDPAQVLELIERTTAPA